MDTLKGFAAFVSLQFATYLISKASDNSFLNAVNIAEKLFVDRRAKVACRAIIQKYTENHPVKQLVQSAFMDLSKNTRKKLIKNLIVNHYVIGNERREQLMKKLGMKVPELFVIDPSGKCNLHCKKCYSGYENPKDELTFEEIDNLLNEASSLSIHLVTFSGGEPFMNPRLAEFIEKHDDIFFLIYTNGLLIDEHIAGKFGEMGNVATAISVEGFEKRTDELRGKGAFKGAIRAMDLLRKHGALFGFSATVLRDKVDSVTSDEFIDFYLAKGCKFGWYFQYLPIGRNPDANLMCTPEERLKLFRRVRQIRNSRPIFLGDFWSDGVFTGGCLAGANPYMHITYNGDVKPCVFAPFTVDNIRDKSFLDVANSDFFKAIRNAHPYCVTKNLLTPCMVIDHPQVLRAAVKKYNARPVVEGAETLVENEGMIKFLNSYSRGMKEVMDPVWEKEYVNNPNSRWYKEKEEFKKLGTNGEVLGKVVTRTVVREKAGVA